MKALGPDNPILSTLNKIVDTMWVSLLWCLLCLPMLMFLFFGLYPIDFITVIDGVEEQTQMAMLLAPGLELKYELVIMGLMTVCSVTVGPASAAVYYAVVKVIRRERSYVTKSFFHSFKVNFKLGALSSLAFGAFVSFMYFDIKYSLNQAILGNGGTMSMILCGVFACISGLGLLFLVWLNPVLSRFDVSFKQLFKNVLLISGKNVFRSIILILFWLAIGYLLIEMMMSETLMKFFMLLPFCLPGVSALVRSFVIEPVFKRLVNEVNESKESTEADPTEDSWYTE